MFYVQFADNHDIHSIKVYELESAKEDKDTDYSKLTPSAALFAPPRGELCSVRNMESTPFPVILLFLVCPILCPTPPPPPQKKKKKKKKNLQGS